MADSALTPTPLRPRRRCGEPSPRPAGRGANSFVVLNELSYQSTTFQTTDRDSPTANPHAPRLYTLLISRLIRSADLTADHDAVAAAPPTATATTPQLRPPFAVPPPLPPRRPLR